MGGGPTRLPRPLTAAELHLELEKEQEAVVNRLTRELSALRAHSASVASTASSSTSAALLDTSADTHSGSTHPTSSRRHRSSSAVSRNQSQGHARGSVSDAGRSGSVHHVSSPRYEEVAYWRAEMEDVKKENAMLRNRIMELERMLREKRDGEKVEKKESEAQGDIAREKEVGVEGSTSAGVSGAS
ncbi:hypothetical protein M011DRAFT_469899 [Sporormia fimetaria CBS 119925]|uniref:BZIP domain-containing protein n=1 Tax=Sporormia fimetaria CBS 119925 TaxID=1340428 RepID=A0A6A6V3X5_9PLEO|nr:hypothetical protein M011DRAFT_469899 [Sporormia fimetaria CBS 119925]